MSEVSRFAVIRSKPLVVRNVGINATDEKMTHDLNADAATSMDIGPTGNFFFPELSSVFAQQPKFYYLIDASQYLYFLQ